MPIFNPNEPHNGIPVDADFLRDQFNCLKALYDAQAATIAALILRIEALENPPLEAVGFGDAMPRTGDMSNNRYADSVYAADITAVNWSPASTPV